MVETRGQAQGHPLKKEGAYNTDAYYQEKDEGFGDVGVNQEPDAAVRQANRKDLDPDFQVSRDEERRADEERNQAVEGDMPIDRDVAEMKAGPTEDVNTRAPGGEPIGIVQTSREDLETQEASDTAA